MDINTFWQVIDTVNGKVDSLDLDGILTETQEQLQQFSPQEIADWKSIQIYYNELADTSGIFTASCLLNDYMSDDGFMDFRAWLISRGRDTYMAALKDPDSLAGLDDIPESTRFEVYNYVAAYAYKQRCGVDGVYDAMDRNPLTKVQEAAIEAEIEYAPFEITGKDDMPRHMPRMVEKYDGSGLQMRYNGQQIL